MEFVDHFVAKARAGDLEDAFHGLRELGLDAFPAMRSVYHGESTPIVRALIAGVVWQLQHASSVDLLADALRDPAQIVWKQALDGLVSLSSPASLRTLRSAMEQEGDAERRAWIEEAIDQVACGGGL